MKRHGMTYARLLADSTRSGPPCTSCLGNRFACSTCSGAKGFCACVRQVGAVVARHYVACGRCKGTGIEPTV